MEYKICPICMGNMICIVDPWTATSYWQCTGCGHILGDDEYV